MIRRTTSLSRPASLLSLTALLSIATLLAGCESLGKMTQSRNMLSLLEGSWEVDSIAGYDLNSLRQQLPESLQFKMPSISIAQDGSISGFSGVNRFSGKTDPAELAKGNLDLSKLASTRMAGLPPLNALENKYLAALATSKVATITTDGKLALGDGKSTLLTFARAK